MTTPGVNRRILEFCEHVLMSRSVVVVCSSGEKSTDITQKTRDWIAKTNPRTHVQGLSVVAPNGAGKTTYVKTHPDWVDGDDLLKGVIGMGKKASMNEEDMKRADSVTKEGKRLGLWILTATWWDPKLVDVFVVPPADVLRERLAKKDFPGDFYEKNIAPYIRETIRPLAKKHDIPIVDDFLKILQKTGKGGV